MAQIYMAMSGCGKTQFCLNNSTKWRDLDSGGLKADPIKLFMLFHNGTGHNVFLDASEVWLKANIIPYLIILPEKSAKAEIIARVKAGTNNSEWSVYYEINYDKIYNMLESVKVPKIYLKANQFIADIIDTDGNIKDGIEVIQPKD